MHHSKHAKHRIVAGAVAALVVLPAATASAGPAEIEHWEDSGGEPFLDCPGLSIHMEYDYRGTVAIGPRGKDGLQYFTVTYRGHNVWTNTETGRSFRMERGGVDKDAKVVDNGDGTLSIIGLSTGTERYYDNDGRLLFSNNGQIRYEVLVDHNGTPTDYTDDGEAIFIDIVKPSTGTNQTDGRDFCDDLAEFTG